VTVHIFVICIAVGAAAVAMWVNFRFPNLMPWKMGRLLVHLVLALLCVYVVSPGMATVMSLGIPAAKIAAVFVVAFPALVYNFLVGAWLIRLAQATGGGFRA
jgi:hypothetical protein